MATSHLQMLTNKITLKDPDYLPNPPINNIMSQSAIIMAKNFRDGKGTRHMERRMHYVREGQSEGKHVLKYIKAEWNLADPNTKNCPATEIHPRLKYIMTEVPE